MSGSGGTGLPVTVLAFDAAASESVSYDTPTQAVAIPLSPLRAASNVFPSSLYLDINTKT